MQDRDFEETVDWPLLARYFSGEAGPAERSELERWIGEAPGRQQEVAALRRLWDDAGLIPSPARVETMWAALSLEMAVADPSLTPSAHSPSPPRNLAAADCLLTPRNLAWTGVAVAAILVSLLVAAFWAGHEFAGGFAGAGGYNLYETGPQQILTVHLGDGTRVTLGPSSELRGSPGPGARREVEVRGAAVFHVAYDADRPLLVRAGSGVTEDPGSVFAVRAYPGTERVQVAVIEGRVALRPEHAPEHSGTLLERGQVGWLDPDGRVEVQETPTPHAYVDWRAGG
jgi:transmembrane sensor